MGRQAGRPLRGRPRAPEREPVALPSGAAVNWPVGGRHPSRRVPSL